MEIQDATIERLSTKVDFGNNLIVIFPEIQKSVMLMHEPLLRPLKEKRKTYNLLLALFLRKSGIVYCENNLDAPIIIKTCKECQFTISLDEIQEIIGWDYSFNNINGDLKQLKKHNFLTFSSRNKDDESYNIGLNIGKISTLLLREKSFNLQFIQ